MLTNPDSLELCEKHIPNTFCKFEVLGALSRQTNDPDRKGERVRLWKLGAQASQSIHPTGIRLEIASALAGPIEGMRDTLKIHVLNSLGAPVGGLKIITESPRRLWEKRGKACQSS